MTVKEKLKYELNVSEDYTTEDIADFIDYFFIGGLCRNKQDIIKVLESEIAEND